MYGGERKGKKVKKKKENERKGKKGKEGGGGGEVILPGFGSCLREEKEREREVRRFTFSVRFTKIELSVFVGTRGKVHLRDKSFA